MKGPKFGTIDRFDSIVFRNNKFVHKDTYVSCEQDMFTMESGVFARFFSKKSIRFGVNKKEHRLSGNGWNISKIYIGEGGS